MPFGFLQSHQKKHSSSPQAKNLYIISVKGIQGRLNRLPAAASGDLVAATVKRGKPELRKKVMPVCLPLPPPQHKNFCFFFSPPLLISPPHLTCIQDAHTLPQPLFIPLLCFLNHPFPFISFYANLCTFFFCINFTWRQKNQETFFKSNKTKHTTN